MLSSGKQFHGVFDVRTSSDEKEQPHDSSEEYSLLHTKSSTKKTEITPHHTTIIPFQKNTPEWQARNNYQEFCCLSVSRLYASEMGTPFHRILSVRGRRFQLLELRALHWILSPLRIRILDSYSTEKRFCCSIAVLNGMWQLLRNCKHCDFLLGKIS